MNCDDCAGGNCDACQKCYCCRPDMDTFPGHWVCCPGCGERVCIALTMGCWDANGGHGPAGQQVECPDCKGTGKAREVSNV